jgi:hypothetical protein
MADDVDLSILIFLNGPVVGRVHLVNVTCLYEDGIHVVLVHVLRASWIRVASIVVHLNQIPVQLIA